MKTTQAKEITPAKAIKSFHGWQCENYFAGHLIITMKRYGGEIKCDATPARCNESEGAVMYELSGPRVTCAVGKPGAMATAQTIARVHAQGVKNFAAWSRDWA